MKIKILLAPFLIVIIAVFSIWLVYPLYSNGFDGVKENYAKLKIEQEKLADIQTMSENVDKLSAQISSMPEKETLYSFIPESGKEEEIINNIVKLSSLSGLFFSEEDIEQPQKNIQEQEVFQSGVETGDILGDVAVPIPAPEPQNLKAKIKIAGKYEKIKEFLVNLEKLGRNNSLEVLEIGKEIAPDAPQDILTVDAVLNFAILKKNKLSQATGMDPIFSSPELESGIIGEIKNKKSINNFQLNVEQKGKSNPFQL